MCLQEHIPAPMHEADVAKVAEQMMVALDFLHQADYAHCDIKVGLVGCSWAATAPVGWHASVHVCTS